MKLLLKNPKKDRLISTYVLDIKRTVDALVAVSTLISVEDHIETILDGLPPDFDPFVASILFIINPYKVAKIKTLLLVQKEHLERHHQLDPLSFPATVTLTSWMPSNPTNYNVNPKFHGTRGGCGFSRSQNFSHGSRISRSQTYGSWNSSKPTCQVCEKYGHAALQCWQWYDHKPNPPPRANISQFLISDTESNDASLLGINSTIEDPLWYPDTGTTHHVTKIPLSTQPSNHIKSLKLLKWVMV